MSWAAHVHFFLLRKHQTANFPPGILWTGDSDNVFSCLITYFILFVRVRYKEHCWSYFVITCCIWLTAVLLPASYYKPSENVGLRLLLWALLHEANRKVKAKKEGFHSERGELPLTENLTWPVAALHSGWQCFLPPLWFLCLSKEVLCPTPKPCQICQLLMIWVGGSTHSALLYFLTETKPGYRLLKYTQMRNTWVWSAVNIKLCWQNQVSLEEKFKCCCEAVRTL